MTKEQIRKAVLAIMEGKIPLVSSWCKVKSVDWPNKTCSVIVDDDEELVVNKVLLGFDKQGSIPKPKADGDVLVVWINNTKTHGAVVMVQEAEELHLMGDSKGGIPVAEDVVDRLNAVENKVNSILSTLKAVVIPLAPSGTYPLSTDFAAETALQNTTVANIENPKVKHGDG